MKLFGVVSEQYADFAERTSGDSPCFEEWARGVAGDAELLALIETLPPVKQQPNLVFAAARWNGVPAPAPFETLRRALVSDWSAIRATVMTRSTQTNEVGRLATLLPAFAEIQARDRRPLALLEVGASAGLCLFPDRYSYQWSDPAGVSTTTLQQTGSPVLRCSVTGSAPLPDRHPVVNWRAGIDLNPLDVEDRDAMAWLSNLVWPEQQHRRARLRDAVEIARREPPHLVRGDLLDALPDLMRQVPQDAVVVVFHTAVIAYLEPVDRKRFQQMMEQLVHTGACHWVSNEGEDVLPGVTATRPDDSLDRLPFVLGVDGVARARTHGHGTQLSWSGSLRVPRGD